MYLSNVSHPPVARDVTFRYAAHDERRTMATIDTIRKILEDNLSIEPEQVEEDTTLDSIDIDSLDLVELICDIEDAEGIDFGEPEGLETIGDIVEHIDSLK